MLYLTGNNMINIKFEFKNLELYTYFILLIILSVVSLYFYGFLKTTVYKTITLGEVILDPSTIRISDVNLSRFEDVSKKIDNKAISKKINSKNFFE